MSTHLMRESAQDAPVRASLATLSLRKSAPRIVANLLVAGIVVWSMFPIYWMIVSSLRPPQFFITANPSLLPGPFTEQYYSLLLSNAGFVLAYVNSFIVALLSTFLSVVAAAMMGYVLARYRFFGSFAFL